MNVRNVAFVDGQNLHLGTRESGWSVDHGKFRTYLRDKYQVDEAHYFLGFRLADEQNLYESLGGLDSFFPSESTPPRPAEARREMSTAISSLA